MFAIRSFSTRAFGLLIDHIQTWLDVMIALLHLSSTLVHWLGLRLLGIDIYQISFLCLSVSINWWSLVLINLSKPIGFNHKFFLAEVGVIFCWSTSLFVHVFSVAWEELLRIPGTAVVRVQRLQVHWVIFLNDGLLTVGIWGGRLALLCFLRIRTIAVPLSVVVKGCICPS